MKSTQKHISYFYRFLVILSGIVMYSILPLDIHSGEYSFTHLVQFETEYYSVNDDNSPADEDSKHSNNFIEQVFKQTSEKKETIVNTDGYAVLKQGITATEVCFIKLTLDKAYFFKRTKHLSVDYSLDLINEAKNNFSLPFQPFINSIAINAP